MTQDTHQLEAFVNTVIIIIIITTTIEFSLGGSRPLVQTKQVIYINETVFVDSCHHGVARPQVADGGTASDMEGGCE